MVPGQPLHTILLADDCLDDCDLIREAWREVPVGRELRCVYDGTELLDYLYRKGFYTERVRSPRPSVIFLDLNMPQMTGYEALSCIKNDTALATIPIIILTTSKAIWDIHKSALWGINGYIQKPNAFSGYLQMLSNLQKNWQEIVERPFGGDASGGSTGRLAYC